MTIRAKICVAALALLGTGCGVFGKDFTVSRTVGVHASMTDPACQDDNLTFNLADDKTFNDIKGNVYSMELKKVVVEVVNPKTDDSSVATRANGSISVSAMVGGELLSLGTYQDVPLTAGANQEIPFDKSAAQRTIDLALHPPNTFFITSHGCADAVPAFFDFKVAMTFYATLGI